MNNTYPGGGVFTPPSYDCARCPRLVDFLCKNRTAYPDWHNGPVPSFGGGDGRLLIVGLAPGLRGANRTGRPFTGDYAGDLLYETLLAFGLATGSYNESATDGLSLIDTRITNAVRCVPPDNKPTTDEIKNCRSFLAEEIQSLKNLRVILTLGHIAHQQVIHCLQKPPRSFPFGHGSIHRIQADLVLINSYHCSRYNTNTGRLTKEMFYAVFERVKKSMLEIQQTEQHTIIAI